VTGIEPPVVEWWAYGGIRVLSGGRVLAWVTEAGAGEEVLFEPPRCGGRFTVGLLYPVSVTRFMGRLRVHGWPIKSRGRVDRELLALLRAEHYAARLTSPCSRRRRWAGSSSMRRSNRCVSSRGD
jgi:hypothetical protein